MIGLFAFMSIGFANLDEHLDKILTSIKELPVSKLFVYTR